MYKLRFQQDVRLDDYANGMRDSPIMVNIGRPIAAVSFAATIHAAIVLLFPLVPFPAAAFH
jgi:hypothetical protein